nr:NADH dehydrogenase subunit 2 [Ixodes ornithorhynchi]
MIITNMVLLWVLSLSIFMAFSTNMWFSFWVSMEINMMVFIPLMNNKNFMSSNSMINYFIIQSFTSSMFLFSSILFTITNFFFFKNIIIMSILIKMASAPFHSWFPQISEGLKMNSFLLLATIQKIIPLQMISIFFSNKIIIFIILSSIFGSLSGFNQTSIRKILAFSSIAHLAWILTLILTCQSFWLMYFFIYSIILMKITLFFNKNKINMINNIHTMKMSNFMKFTLFSYMMSLAGLPPFLGFMMKWASMILILKKTMLILLILIMSSLINMYFYMRILFPMILNLNTSLKLSHMSSMKSNFFYVNLISIFMLIISFKSL